MCQFYALTYDWFNCISSKQHSCNKLPSTSWLWLTFFYSCQITYYVQISNYTIILFIWNRVNTIHPKCLGIINYLQRYGCNLLFIHAVMFFTPKNCNQSMEIIILLKKESKLKAMMCNIYVNNILFPMRDAKRIQILTSYFKFKRGNALGQIAFISCQLNQRLDCSFLLRQDLNY